MRPGILHLRPSVGREIVAPVALCGAAPGDPDYLELTTAEYVTLFLPKQHPRGRICARCADRFALALREHRDAKRGERP